MLDNLGPHRVSERSRSFSNQFVDLITQIVWKVRCRGEKKDVHIDVGASRVLAIAGRLNQWIKSRNIGVGELDLSGDGRELLNDLLVVRALLLGKGGGISQRLNLVGEVVPGRCNSCRVADVPQRATLISDLLVESEPLL